MPGFGDTAPRTNDEPCYQTVAFEGPDVPGDDPFRAPGRRDPSDVIKRLDAFLNTTYYAGRVAVLDAVMLTEQGRSCRFITTAPAPQAQQVAPRPELPRLSAAPESLEPGV